MRASLVAAQSPAPSGGTFAVRVDAGVRVTMRDGVSLVCDIYRPASDGRFPVLLQRTPYNRKDPAAGMFLASHGYVVILQDTRGRFDSSGEFYPFRHEANDGYDTVEWAAALPYADGRVGMFGGSYVGATQMLAASAAPPHLVAIFPYVTAAEYYEGWTYQGGAMMQWFAESWTSGLVDVDQHGDARYLADGIIRARYRNSTAAAEPIEPNRIYKYTIDLWATSNVFKAGHRVRVYVSSSNFPRFSRNLNTGEKTSAGAAMIRAKQTIYHDADHPSAVVLPVIPART
jgi:predicted acyl esterase